MFIWKTFELSIPLVIKITYELKILLGIEGDFELKYLKWIVKNHISEELCKSERSRWLSQVNLKLNEVMDGIAKCPLTLDDFIYGNLLVRPHGNVGLFFNVLLSCQHCHHFIQIVGWK